MKRNGASPTPRPGQLGRLARAVLHDLLAVGDLHAKARAVAEVLADHLAAPAGDDENFGDLRFVAQALDDALQDRLALDLEHRLGDGLGQLAHARALASGEDDGLGDAAEGIGGSAHVALM